VPTLYLTEQGSKLKKTSKRLVVEKDGKILLEVPEFKVDQILIFGNVQITTQALNFLLSSGIPTSLLSSYGKLRGKLMPVEGKNVHLRIIQVKRLEDEEFTLSLAKEIVRCKIKNQRSLLMRYSRNHPEMNFKEQASELKKLLDALEARTKVSTVMGIEGRASAVYFEAFGKMFRKELKFERREKRPPTDPINALLSLGYTLLINEASSALAAIGLDPYIGYLHGVEYGRPSLALDLAEQFRQPLIDTLTLSLINKGVLKASDFEEEKTAGVYLKEEARKVYFYHYEKKLQEQIQIHSSQSSYRRLLHQEAHKLAKTIREKVPYKPYILN
jgi:CRISPR-associated protein Cas1